MISDLLRRSARKTDEGACRDAWAHPGDTYYRLQLNLFCENGNHFLLPFFRLLFTFEVRRRGAGSSSQLSFFQMARSSAADSNKRITEFTAIHKWKMSLFHCIFHDGILDDG